MKGYLTNSPLDDSEILENYAHLWQIEKAFRVAKGELRISRFSITSDAGSRRTSA